MSIHEQAAIENMVFNYGSTYQTDYRHGQIDTSQRTVYKPKPKTEKTVPFERKDFHTLAKFAIEVPFSLCIKPKEIVRTNPYDVPKPLPQEPDTGRELAIRTRPRLYITPAFSLDEVPPHARDVVIRDVYTSQYTFSNEQVKLPTPGVTAPLPDLAAPAKAVHLPKPQPPAVPREWRMESVQWERSQARYPLDRDREFWSNYDVYKGCNACKETAQYRKYQKLQNKNNPLR
ncbi:hypothetical protein JYU34_002875 [Plutella xylostella]|uniref:Uncharacterized protein n=1 Tax=Plutella xylostella TaxID=51655 RepID=A0ABQ7R3C4_PLUXY|nr:hypothetical protein JYU34_002875 [Plutella xylostella]